VGAERAKALPPSLDECDSAFVVIMVPFIHGNGAFGMTCVVRYYAHRVRFVECEEGWRTKIAEHGYPPDHEETEQLIESLAWVEWLRRMP
jgi:hypothetical protein